MTSKAIMEIEALRAEKQDLADKLNQEINLHNDEKRRRLWVEEEFRRVLNILQQQGVRIPAIEFPAWYYQTSPLSQQATTVPTIPTAQQVQHVSQHSVPNSQRYLFHPDAGQYSPTFANQQQGHPYSQQNIQQSPQNAQQMTEYPE